MYWANGQLKRSVHFQNGMRSGLDQMWNEEGVLVDSGSYEEGLPVGVHRRWNAAGVLIEEIVYEKGKWVSFRSWDDEGNLLLEKQTDFNLMEHYPKLALLLPSLIPIETPYESLKTFDVGAAEGIFVYGLGNGAPYFQLKHWLHAKPERKLIFLEDELGHLAYFLKSPKRSLLSDKQVHLEFMETENLQEIAEKFPMERFEIVAIPSKQGKVFKKLKAELFRKAALSHALYQDRLHGHYPFQNFVQNMRHLPTSFYANGFEGAFQGMPAIVCGAGPSLKEAIPLLKQLSGKALIIAGGSTLAALSSQGVPIHFGMAIDPNLEEYRRLKNSFAFDTPLLYSTRVHPSVFQTCAGPFGYMRSGIGGVLEVWMEEQLGLLDPLIGKNLSPESMSVTTICTAWAQFIGCSTILFSGVDLAYTNQKRYAEGVEREEEISFSLLDAEKSSPDRIVKRKNHLGKTVFTAIRWIMESASLSHFAKKHPEVRFINTTAGGIKMQGIPYMSLEDVALKESFDFPRLIQQQITKCPMPADSRETIAAKMGELKESLARVVGCLETLCGEKKGSKVLAEFELQEELAMDLLFYDMNEVLGKEKALTLQEKWARLLVLARKYRI